MSSSVSSSSAISSPIVPPSEGGGGGGGPPCSHPLKPAILLTRLLFIAPPAIFAASQFEFILSEKTLVIPLLFVSSPSSGLLPGLERNPPPLPPLPPLSPPSSATASTVPDFAGNVDGVPCS